MFRVARVLCFAVLLLLVSGGGCDDEGPRSRSRPSGSATSGSTSATPSETPIVETTVPSVTPTTESSGRLSGIATRTGYFIEHDNAPIDDAGLRALGWTKVDPVGGTARWSDPALGTYSVTWEVPDERAIAFFDVSFWGDVTGNNLAINPSMYSTVFTSTVTEVTAHSLGGVKAETPIGRLRVTVPEQLAGTTASVELNLGFPQPALVVYTYTYE
jgi:hypothetical protein